VPHADPGWDGGIPAIGIVVDQKSPYGGRLVCDKGNTLAGMS